MILTESYLKKLIKQVLNEISREQVKKTSEQSEDPEDYEETEEGKKYVTSKDPWKATAPSTTVRKKQPTNK
jgi:hypothetical protein